MVPRLAASSRFLTCPAFLMVVWTMYWSLPLANLCLCIKSWKLLGGRNDLYRLCQCVVSLLRLRVRKLGSNEVYRDGPCMYLSNHRSWADFFIDAYLTEGRGQLMSRLAVLFVFPLGMTALMNVRSCICFKRGSIADKQKFNAWISRCISVSPVPGICLFPEGHRNRLPTSLPLKRGMLHYAYNTDMPVQVVMTSHKEQVLDESRFHVRFGATCVTGFGGAIHPGSYATFEDFAGAVQASWDDLWLSVFSADPVSLPLLAPRVPGWRYPIPMRASQLLLSLLQGLLCAWTLRLGWGVWAAAALWLGQVLGLAAGSQTVLLALPVLWLAASVAFCWDGSLPKPVLPADGTVVLHVNRHRLKAA